jgi:crossover junction endodeoxyribonuclease RusA
MTTTRSFRLPWPVSVNSIYRRTRNGTALSARAKQYRDAVAWTCYEQHVQRWADTPIEISITAHPPDAKPRDLDNLLKATLDALESCRVIDDDVNVWRITIERGPRDPSSKRRGRGFLTVRIDERKETDHE